MLWKYINGYDQYLPKKNNIPYDMLHRDFNGINPLPDNTSNGAGNGRKISTTTTVITIRKHKFQQ